MSESTRNSFVDPFGHTRNDICHGIKEIQPGKKDIMTSRLKLLADTGAVGFHYIRTINWCAYLMSSILYYEICI